MYSIHTFVGHHVHPQTRKEYDYEVFYNGGHRVAWNVKIKSSYCFCFVNSGVIDNNGLFGTALQEVIRAAVESGIADIDTMRQPQQNPQVVRTPAYA